MAHFAVGALGAAALGVAYERRNRNAPETIALNRMYARYGQRAVATGAIAKKLYDARSSNIATQAMIARHAAQYEASRPRITDYFSPRGSAMDLDDGSSDPFFRRFSSNADQFGLDPFQPKMVLDPTMRYRRSTRVRNRRLIRRFGRRKFGAKYKRSFRRFKRRRYF